MRNKSDRVLGAPIAGSPQGMSSDKRRRPTISLILVAAVVAVGLLLGGCASNGSQSDGAAIPKRAAPTKHVAAEDRALTQRSTAAQNHARLVAAIRKHWRQQRAAAVKADRKARRVTHPGSVVRTVTVSVSSAGAPLCAHRHGNRAALYYLNLSCPR
jgi:hypothetical protein